MDKKELFEIGIEAQRHMLNNLLRPTLFACRAIHDHNQPNCEFKRAPH